MNEALGPSTPAAAGAEAHAFVVDLDRPELTDEDRHHLERVLRLRPGVPVTVSDGRGHWRTVRFGPTLEPDGPVIAVSRLAPPITIAFAVPKGERPEMVVQKLTELGVDEIVPFHAAHSVVRWEGERAVRHVERLRRVAREAAMQSRRCWLPMVTDVTRFSDVASRPGAVRADQRGVGPTLRQSVVLVGPEGGWSASECEVLSHSVALGDHVLRAETAAITAASLLTALRLGLVAPMSGQNVT
ncbi:MAG TPA: RsmE family RNA methyltransferase [Acidimicrobiales bacterium]